MGAKKRELKPKHQAPENPDVAAGVSVAIPTELWSIDRLKAYEKNPRKITPRAIDAIANSLKEFGFRQPIVVDSRGVVIAGHTRLQGALKLGMRTVPVHVASDLSATRVRAYRLADNVKLTDWLDEILAEELLELKDDGFDLDLLGFSGNEIDKLLAPDEEAMERADADAPAIPENPVTTKGDVWLLGNHRIVCGDSTVATDVAKALNGAVPHLCVTDPPYGVEYDAGWRDEAAKHAKSMGNRKDTAKGKVLNDDRADWTEAYSLFPGEVIYVWHPPGATQVDFHNSLVAAGFVVRMQIIWAKSHIVIGRGNYQMQHEPCWYAVRKKQGATAHWQGSRTESTLWQINKPQKSETGHSTQKPIECMQRPIVNNSKEGDAVYEPFSGSGTTIIAAEMTGRICHAIELNEAYVDVAVMRWQTFTNKAATLEGDGRTFDEIKASRMKDAA